MSKPDLAHLQRAIELGSADAARDAGLRHFHINVKIIDLTNTIDVEVYILTPEQAKEFAERLLAEQRKRDAGN